MNMHRRRQLFAWMCALSGITSAMSPDAAGVTLAGADTAYPRLSFAPSLQFSVMQIVNTSMLGQFEAGTQKIYNGAWYQSYGGSLPINVFVTPHLTLNLTLSGGMWHNLQTIQGGYAGAAGLSRKKSAYFNATGEYRFGRPDSPWVTATAGYFSFNYAKDNVNLGGYLFRSLPYPTVIFSGGGGENFLGIRLNSGVIPHVTQDLLIWSELFYPYGDISLGYVFDCALIKNSVSMGAGIVFHRLIPADPDLTTDTILARYPAQEDTTRLVTYSFSGVKTMARLSFDVNKLARIPQMGPQDLKLYAEAAVLGLKDYPLKATSPVVGYPSIRERIPVMAGMNLPTHPIAAWGVAPAGLAAFLIGIEDDSVWYDTVTTSGDGGEETRIDTMTQVRGFAYKPQRMVIWAGASALAAAAALLVERFSGASMRPDRMALEVQFFGSPFMNWRPDDNQPPLPEELPGDKGRTDNWKWSIAVSRTIFNRLSLSARASSDNLRIRDENGQTMIPELLVSTNEWYWAFGARYSF